MRPRNTWTTLPQYVCAILFPCVALYTSEMESTVSRRYVIRNDFLATTPLTAFSPSLSLLLSFPPFLRLSVRLSCSLSACTDAQRVERDTRSLSTRFHSAILPSSLFLSLFRSLSGGRSCVNRTPWYIIRRWIGRFILLVSRPSGRYRGRGAANRTHTGLEDK